MLSSRLAESVPQFAVVHFVFILWQSKMAFLSLRLLRLLSRFKMKEWEKVMWSSRYSPPVLVGFVDFIPPCDTAGSRAPQIVLGYIAPQMDPLAPWKSVSSTCECGNLKIVGSWAPLVRLKIVGSGTQLVVRLKIVGSVAPLLYPCGADMTAVGLYWVPVWSLPAHLLVEFSRGAI